MNDPRQELAGLVSWIHAKGWTPATGGNFSALQTREPLTYLVTPSGVDKGSVQAHQLVLVDDLGAKIEGDLKPSDETLLHSPIYQLMEAGFVAHTHTVWNTLASLHPGDSFDINGLEMVKALKGNKTHLMTERVPIIENSQDMQSLCRELTNVLREFPQSHGVLLRGHGLYTWGSDIFETKRHLEAFEFLFETVLRQRAFGLH